MVPRSIKPPHKSPSGAMSSVIYYAAITTATLLLASVLTTTTTAPARATAADRDAVYFSLVVSSSPTLNTSGVVGAVDEALELIENDTTILPGYTLQYSQVLDAQVRLVNHTVRVVKLDFVGMIKWELKYWMHVPRPCFSCL